MSELRDDFLFDMAIDDVDSETMEWLKGQDFYREWQREQSENEEKFPCIVKLLDGKGELFLTEGEHEAVVHYLEIQQKMESAERREYYRFGHVHALKYWKELGERRSYAADEMGIDFVQASGKEWCQIEDLPDWLDGFIQHLDHLLTEKLEQNPGWLKLKQNEQEILQRHPVIQKLLEGDLEKKAVTLSTEEQEGFEKFFSLQLHMDSYRELALYMIGQGELVKYFCGMF